MERIHALLTEHEETLYIARELARSVELIARDDDTAELDAAGKLRFILDTIVPKLNALPEHAHAHERSVYVRNARRNIRARSDNARRRRNAGIEPRKAPGAPDELAHEYRVHREMYGLDDTSRSSNTRILGDLNRFMMQQFVQQKGEPIHRTRIMEFLASHGISHEQAFRVLELAIQMGWILPLPNTLLYTPKARPQAAAAEPTKNEEFLANLPPPEIKSDEQIAAEATQMLDSIENE
jgi:hypothetical protein